jgi:hypothetical protein
MQCVSFRTQAIGRLLKPKSLGRARLACRSFCDAMGAAASRIKIDLSKCHEYGPRLPKLLKLLHASADLTILIPLAPHTSPAAPLRKLLADIHPNCRVRLLVRAAAQLPAESTRRLVLGLRHALEYLPGRNFLLAVPRFEPAPRSLESFLDWRSYDEMLEQERALHASHLLVSSQLLAHAMPLAGLETASLTLGSLDHGQLRHLAGCARLTVRPPAAGQHSSLGQAAHALHATQSRAVPKRLAPLMRHVCTRPAAGVGAGAGLGPCAQAQRGAGRPQEQHPAARLRRAGWRQLPAQPQPALRPAAASQHAGRRRRPSRHQAA